MHERILIVDDEAPVANLLEQALRNEGYETARADDGRGNPACTIFHPADSVAASGGWSDPFDLVTYGEAEVGDLAEKHGVEIRVVTFDNLAVDAARDNGATVIVRGLRDGTDFDYEMQMAGMNAALAPQLKTVFLPATEEEPAPELAPAEQDLHAGRGEHLLDGHR